MTFVQVVVYLYRMTRDEDSMSIADVYRRDEGVYTCRVKTELEEVNASAKLTVMGIYIYTHTHREGGAGGMENYYLQNVSV